MSNKLIISWEKFREDTRAIADFFGGFNITTLVAVTRGGLYVAAELAHLMDIRDIRTICVSSYDEANLQAALQIHYVCNFDPAFSLIVDDISDSGKTFMWVACNYKQPLKTAVLYKKSHSVYCPTFSVEHIPSDKWVVFPWEVRK